MFLSALAAADRCGTRAEQDALRRHGTEQPLERYLHVLAPGERGPQFHSEPRVLMVRPDGLEPDREQEIGREHAARCGPLLVAKGLDRPDAASGQVLGHSLNKHSTEAAAGKFAD